MRSLQTSRQLVYQTIEVCVCVCVQIIIFLVEKYVERGVCVWCTRLDTEKHTLNFFESVAGKLSGQAIARDCSDRGSASRNRFADAVVAHAPHQLRTIYQHQCGGGKWGWSEGRSRRRLRNMPPTPKTPKTNYIRPDGRRTVVSPSRFGRVLAKATPTLSFASCFAPLLHLLSIPLPLGVFDDKRCVIGKFCEKLEIHAVSVLVRRRR